MFPHNLGEVVQHLERIVKLASGAVRQAEGQSSGAEQANRGNAFAFRVNGEDAKSTPGVTEIGDFPEPPCGVVQSERRPCEVEPRLVHCRGAEVARVAHVELLSARGRNGGEAGDVGRERREGAQDSRVVEVVIERPVARQLIIEVNALRPLVVANGLLFGAG